LSDGKLQNTKTPNGMTKQNMPSHLTLVFMPLKSFKFPNFQIAKTKQHPHDTNSLLIYHHQIHPNPMMQKNKKE